MPHPTDEGWEEFFGHFVLCTKADGVVGVFADVQAKEHPETSGYLSRRSFIASGRWPGDIDS